ncbi:LPS biosynthesis glycosyltransferase [Nostoc minutum NIES-26]|uniref:LPS biosynthesis glycosyltransferase n=1 Tax=Nostoc minutum NIES-26 TaxID=1844469 RepID=A0A367S459_9NOSO|nr:LPS biosynthesis glycosyltransferase [Nostoc minutum NIES-26]
MRAIAATVANQKLGKNHLVNCISRVLIIAYQESTQQLEEVLTQEKLQYEVLRQGNKPEFQHFSRSYLCLMNHRRAWAKAAQEDRPTIIIEADFVPVVNFGKLPLPFNSNQTDVGVSWLYTCAPQVYHVSVDGYAEGFSTSTVAYTVTSKSARYLIELAEEVREKVGAANYSTWDSTVDSFLRHRKLKNYIVWRNYGEHGGLPNPEHYQNKLSRTHRADVLYGKLTFTPLYAAHARSRKLKLLTVRLKARLKGIARLVTGRFLRVKVIRGSSVPVRLISFAILRQLSLQL